MRRYNISDAVAYLLEKAGDIQGAFGIMRESLQAKIKGIEEAATKQKKNKRDEGCQGNAIKRLFMHTGTRQCFFEL